MSLDLRDFRGKITVEADTVLDAEARACRRDKSEIVREILHAWAIKRIMAANVLRHHMKAEGIAREDGGVSGIDEP